MKKVILSLIMFVCLFSISGCDFETETSDVVSYVGTYEKYSSTMGEMTGGHLINFYNDGTLEIYYGFLAGIGSSNGMMRGSYVLEDSDTSISYTFGDDEYKTKFNIEEDSFRTQIFLGASMPDDGLDASLPGITYYKVETLDFHPMSNVLIASKLVDGKIVAYILEMKSDKTFNLVANFDGNNVIINGVYKSVVNGLDYDDEIEFTYILSNEEVVVSCVYNNTKSFKFNLQHDLNTSNDQTILTNIQ